MRNYTNIKGFHSRKITSLPNLRASVQSMSKIYRMLIARHTSESRHDQFPRSSLGTRGLQTRSHRQKNEKTAFLESRSAKASSTNKSNIKFVMLFGVLMKELLQDE